MCIVCGFESRCLSTISSNIPFDLKAIIFQKNFDFSELPPNNLPSLLWTWRISPWFLDISRYQCWQPTDKTSGLSKVLRIWFPCFDSQDSEQWISVFQSRQKQNSFSRRMCRYCFRQKNPALHFWNLGFITTSFYVTWKMVCPSIQDSFAGRRSLMVLPLLLCPLNSAFLPPAAAFN